MLTPNDMMLVAIFIVALLLLRALLKLDVQAQLPEAISIVVRRKLVGMILGLAALEVFLIWLFYQGLKAEGLL